MYIKQDPEYIAFFQRKSENTESTPCHSGKIKHGSQATSDVMLVLS